MEASNVKAMREALELMTDLFDKGVICTSYANTPEEIEQIEELYRKSKAALSAPPRNCDVGSAEEQYWRHDKFCDAARNRMSGYHCEYAPRCAFCFSKWEQMPY